MHTSFNIQRLKWKFLFTDSRSEHDKDEDWWLVQQPQIGNGLYAVDSLYRTTELYWEEAWECTGLDTYRIQVGVILGEKTASRKPDPHVEKLDREVTKLKFKESS